MISSLLHVGNASYIFFHAPASYAKVVYWLYSTLWLMVNTSPVSYLCSDKVLCYGFLILCNHRSTNNQFNKNEPSLNLQNVSGAWLGFFSASSGPE